MRKAQTVQKVPFLAPDVVTKVIPSPTDGWDAISPLAEMDPKRAVILQNFVCRPGYVELRGGYIYFSILADPDEPTAVAPVETLMVYRAPSGEKLFAASGDDIYDVSSGLPVEAISGIGSARIQYVNFTAASGTHVIQCASGADPLRMYDGTSWTTPSITGLPPGLTSGSIVNIHAQKQRLWYMFNNSTVVAFLPAGAITGPIASTQDLGLLFTKGGYLLSMASWTIDGGSGPQDYVAFISSRGQVSLYAGTDPTNASAWQLVGTFDLSPPIGRRCATRVGSDVALITQAGVIPISQALPFDPSADRSVAITARIQDMMASHAQLYANNFGWEFTLFPMQQLAILNVPQETGVQQVQFVMNTLTGSWSLFTGWNANCFAIFNDNLYWGDNAGNVNQGYISSADLFDPIPADMQCAFNWLDEPGRTKRMTMVQPLLTLSEGITPTLAVDADFSTSSTQAPITTTFGGAQWDTALWDTAQWPVNTINYKSFLSVDALGHALAIRLRVTLIGANSQSGSTFDFAQFDLSGFDGTFNSALPTLQVNAFNTISEMGGAI